jgi:hypothetical protein
VGLKLGSEDKGNHTPKVLFKRKTTNRSQLIEARNQKPSHHSSANVLEARRRIPDSER